MKLFQVVEQEADTVHVKYTKKCGENLDVWPQIEDDSCEPVQSILCRMEIPFLAPEREHFQFKDIDIDRIKAMASEKLK